MSNDRHFISKALLGEIFDDKIMRHIGSTYTVTSDAQCECGEDIMLYKLLHTVENGFYVDIGCSDPFIESVTNFFYQRGWRGINIDAREETIQKYASVRDRDINWCAALSNADGKPLTLYVRGGLTSLAKDNVNRLGKETFEERTIVTSTFNALMEGTHIEDIHFLKIDVEAHEKEVLEGIDLRKYRPWVIVIESVLPNSRIETHHEWEEIFNENDYMFFTRHAVNRYYLSKEKYQELLENFLCGLLSNPHGSHLSVFYAGQAAVENGPQEARRRPLPALPPQSIF